MNKKELLEWYGTSWVKSHIVDYQEIDRADNYHVYIDEKAYRHPNVWSIFSDNGKWYFIETSDFSDKGDFNFIVEFDSEHDCCLYAKERLQYLAGSKLDQVKNTENNRVVKYLKLKTNYTDQQIEKFLSHLALYQSLYDEFEEYIMDWGFCGDDEDMVELHGFTAKGLYEQYELSVPEVFKYMIMLIEIPVLAKAKIAFLTKRKKPPIF